MQEIQKQKQSEIKSNEEENLNEHSYYDPNVDKENQFCCKQQKLILLYY